MSSVCMFVKNSFEHDPRVAREARALVAHGYAVTVVALHVDGVTARRETTDYGAHVVRVRQLDFGLTRLNWQLARRAEQRERQRAAAEGRAPDVPAAVRRATLPLSTTATPGSSPLRSDRASGTGPAPSAAPAAPARGARLVRTAFTAAHRMAGPAVRTIRGVYVSWQMARVGVRLDADVYHAHDLNTLDAGVRCARRTGARLVYDAHEMHSARAGMGPARRRWSTRRERALVRHADAVLTVSPSIARHLRSLPGSPAVTVVRNVPERPEPGPPLDLRVALGIPETLRVVVYEGTVQRHRGIEELMAAVALVDGCVLVVIGHGDHRPVLEDEVARIGRGETVRFLGPVPHHEMVRWCAGADVGTACIQNVSTSYFYALPNKVFEYLMAGLPVVVSDFPDMAEVVARYDVGAVCDPADPRGIAGALRAVLDDPAANERYRRNARRAADECNWAEEQQLLVGVYAALSGCAGPRPDGAVRGSAG